MLGQLFGSNSRVKILKIFLFNPEEKYYIRELARKLKLQVNSVRRELDNLEKFGILVSGSNIETEIKIEDEYSPYGPKKKKPASTPPSVKISADKPFGKAQDKHEKKYFKANYDFVLFEEIKSLIIKAQILYGQDFIKKVNKTGNVKLLVMTGKFVNRPEFPVDMLIVGRLKKDKLLRLIKDLERELGREINYALMDYKEYKYRREITDVFLYSILEGKRIIAVDEVGVS